MQSCASAARLLLLARTPLPPREEWDRWLAEHAPDERITTIIRNVRAIEEAGGEVLTAVADVADFAAMGQAIDSARARWGRIDGVIHAAGVVGNGSPAFLKRSDEVQAVLSPKVDGLAVLVRLLGDTPLDFVALMSSISSVLGAPGVCDYAAANAVLDAFVDGARRPAAWRHVVVFDWETWRDVGMATRVIVAESRRAAWEKYLKSAIPPMSGLEVFARVLASGHSRVVISPHDLIHAAASARQPSRVRADKADQPDEITPALHARPDPLSASEAPTTEIERHLADIWTELLGVEQIGVHDDFFQLGGHSLFATRMLVRIDSVIGVRLTLRDVFDAPTIDRLAKRIHDASCSVFGRTGANHDREELEF